MNVILWVGFALGVLNVIAWAAFVIASRRFWRQLKPHVEPLLSMFLPPDDS